MENRIIHIGVKPILTLSGHWLMFLPNDAEILWQNPEYPHFYKDFALTTVNWLDEYGQYQTGKLNKWEEANLGVSLIGYTFDPRGIHL